MKGLSGREFARLVERHGWTLLRVHGSHHIYGRVGSVVRLSIPIHGNRPLKTGLLAILQSSRSFRLASWISAMIRQHDDAARRRQEDVGEHRQGVVTVARMERSDIRGDTFRDARLSPDVAALHPGYEAGKALGVA